MVLCSLLFYLYLVSLFSFFALDFLVHIVQEIYIYVCLYGARINISAIIITVLFIYPSSSIHSFSFIPLPLFSPALPSTTTTTSQPYTCTKRRLTNTSIKNNNDNNGDDDGDTDSGGEDGVTGGGGGGVLVMITRPFITSHPLSLLPLLQIN